MSFSPASLNQVTDLDQRLKILSILGEIQRVAQQGFGITITPFSPHSLDKFLKMEPARRSMVEIGLEHFLAIFLDAEREAPLDCSVESQIRCVRSALWKYGLYAKHDWESYIEAGDVIEIYDNTNTQIYRNLEFLRFCSYDFLDVVTNEWFVLWDRPGFIVEGLKDWIAAVFETGEPIAPQVPEHTMREKAAAQRAFVTRFKWFIPLFRIGFSRPVAFIDIVSAHEVDDKTLQPPIKALEKLIEVTV